MNSLSRNALSDSIQSSTMIHFLLAFSINLKHFNGSLLLLSNMGPHTTKKFSIQKYRKSIVTEMFRDLVCVLFVLVS